MVDIIGRTKVIVESSVDQSSLDSTGGKLGAGLKKGALIGVAALGTVAAAAIPLVKSFEEAEAQSRKLAKVLQNMGEGGAVDEVEKLADSLQRVTGIDDEVIKGGQTILATFSAIADSAGETGGTFDRATRAALDMSSVFGSVEGAARVLGKALSDPEKAATLLRRSNVILTEEQKNLITAFTDAGDAAGAQDVILDALEDRYKGTAETAATESEKIARAADEIKETLGGLVVDLFTDEDTEKNKNFSDSLFKVNDQLQELEKSKSWEVIETAVQGIGFAFGKVGEAIGAYIEFNRKAGEGFGEFVDDVQDGWEAIKTQLSSDLDSIGEAIKNAPAKFLSAAGKAFRSLGSSLLKNFMDGFISGTGTAAIGQKIKDAINQALPDTVTFFGGKGGVPAVTVKVPQFASGVQNFGGGLALVGEQGPELVNLPRGSDVYSNQQSRKMGGGDTYVYAPQINGPTTSSALLAEYDWANRFKSQYGRSA